MDIDIFPVPYDSGHAGIRMGAGPDRLLGAGLVEHLRHVGGGEVAVHRIEAEDAGVPAEIRMAFDLNRMLAPRVHAAVEQGRFPVILTGNCIASVGVLSGLSAAEPAVLWLDAHGDFNTPETTRSGFLDGMALTILTGRCWARMVASIPGFRPIPEERILLLGVRDLDPSERELLLHSRVGVLDPAEARQEVEAALDRLRTYADDLYIHVDLDVLDPVEARANSFAAPGGLRTREVITALRAARERFQVRAISLAAYDPSCDPGGSVCDTAFALLEALLGPTEASAGTTAKVADT